MIKIDEFRSYRRGTLRGFAKIRLGASGVVIDGCTIHERDGRRWVSLPARPYEDDDGNQKYSPIVRIEPKERYEKFQAEAVRALEPHLDEPRAEAPTEGPVENDIPF